MDTMEMEADTGAAMASLIAVYIKAWETTRVLGVMVLFIVFTFRSLEQHVLKNLFKWRIKKYI